LTNIPVGTLESRVSRKSNQPVGHPTALATIQEKHLIDLIITLQDYGELSTFDDALNYSVEFVDMMNLKFRFKNGGPTRAWYYDFQSSSKEYQNAINILDDALQATNSAVLSTSCTSTQSLASQSFSSQSDTLLLNTNDNSLASSRSQENDHSLDDIEMIIMKDFPQSTTTTAKTKRRLVYGTHGKSITDLDEFALTAIKKQKKTTERQVAKKSNTKETTNKQKQTVSLNIHIYNANAINTTNATPIDTHTASLSPITYMLPTNVSTTISSLQPNLGLYAPLQSSTSTQYQLCFNFIKPLETISNCNQCHSILCWECSCKIDTNYQICYICRSYYTIQQQNLFQ
ncbi:unnamed protein product, partial [Rotaria sp. Silwood2]